MTWPDDYIKVIGIEPYYQDDSGIMYCADCMDILPKLPEKSIDLVLTDPPYNFTTASAGAGKLNPWADLTNSAYWFSAWLGKCLKTLKSDAAIWQFCNWRSIPTVTKSVFDIGYQYDIQRFKWSSIKPNGHPAEKPVKLLNWLIEISNSDIILDPFAGSFTTAVAAKQLGRKWIGIEIEKKYCDIGIQRLSQEILI